MDQPAEPERGPQRRQTSVAKPWHAPKALPPTHGRFVALRPPRFVPGDPGRHQAAIAALVELLTDRGAGVKAEATTSPRVLDFRPPSRCPRPSQPTQEEPSR